MLHNLQAVYWALEDWPKTLAITDRLLAADPTLVAVVRDRGTALTRLGEYRRGLADWERYLTERPQAPDAEALRGELRRARKIGRASCRERGEKQGGGEYEST